MKGLRLTDPKLRPSFPSQKVEGRDGGTREKENERLSQDHMGFPRIRGTLLRVPIIRIIVFGGLYWGPLIWKLPYQIFR